MKKAEETEQKTTATVLAADSTAASLFLNIKSQMNNKNKCAAKEKAPIKCSEVEFMKTHILWCDFASLVRSKIRLTLTTWLPNRI